MEIISTPVLFPPLFTHRIYGLCLTQGLLRLGAAALLTRSPLLLQQPHGSESASRRGAKSQPQLTTSAFVFSKKASAKTVTTKMLMMKETKRAMQDSMKKYLLASCTSFLFARLTCRD